MLRFKTLGSLQLCGEDGEELTHTIGQPKRLALLAYMAIVGGDRYVRRDTLVALLWPELPQERARAALRKALHYLRGALGNEVLRTRGDDEVCVDLSKLHCDAREVKTLTDRGEWASALESCNGEFLEGLHVSDAREFEAWLDGERFRLANIALRCAMTHARSLVGRGAVDEAIACARRAVAMRPTDEASNQLLISTLLDVGDRSAAVTAYNRFAECLARELELEPSSDLRALLDRARTSDIGLPSRSTAQVAVPKSENVPTVEGSQPLPRHRIAPRAALGLLLLIIVASAMWSLWRFMTRDRDDVLVMFPLHMNTTDTSFVTLREGAVDLLDVLLASDSAPRVLDARLAVSTWNRAVRQLGRDLTVDESRDLGRKLGASRVLVASVLATPGFATASGRIVRVSDGGIVAEYSITNPRADLSLITRLLTRLSARMSGEAVHRLPRLSDSSTAVVAYLSGMRAYRLGQDEKAYQDFTRALEIDSTFAAAALWRSFAARMSVTGDVIAADKRAWALRQRLDRRDRALLSARYAIGPNYPEPSTDAELLAAAERAAYENPDRAEALADWGRQMLQDGALAGIGNSRELAAAILDSAIALDSNFNAALDVRLWASVELGRRDDISRMFNLYLKHNPDAEMSDLERWMVARALADSTALHRLRTRFPDFSNVLVRFMAAHGAVMGTSLADPESALAIQAASGKLKPGWRMQLLPIAAARGETRVASAMIDTISKLSPALSDPAVIVSSLAIESAIADSDFVPAANDAAARLEAAAATTKSAIIRTTALCYSSLWRASRGDTSGIRAAITRIRDETRGVPIGLFPRVGRLDICPRLLEAQLENGREVLRHSPALDRLESVMARGVGFEWPGNLANLMIARWRAAQGDFPRALAASRRTMHALASNGSFVPLRPAFLREAGRLAALTGDTVSAVRAYGAYLAMRDRPDDETMRNEVQHVQSSIALLRRRSVPARQRE